MPVDPALLLGFLVLSGLLSAVPGPSVVLETTQAVVRGRAIALWIVLGNSLGGLLLLALVVAGLGAVVTASAHALLVIKALGAGYLAWLGITAILAARRDDASSLRETSADPARRPGRVRSVRQGFLVGVGNPKSIVALMAILPQFVDHSRGHVVLQMAVIGLCGALLQALVESTWVLAASSLRSWFLRQPRRLRRLRTVGGAAMLGLAGKLALQR